MLSLAEPRPTAARRQPMRTGVLSVERLQWLCLALPLAATLYSAVIAFGVAHGAGGSYSLVVVCEVGLLVVAVLTLLASGLREGDWAPVFLLFFLTLVALVVSIINDRLMLETLRSIFLIGIFALIGQRTAPRTIDRLFLWVSIAVLVVLLLEIFVQPLYVSLFQPQQFFAATRGIQASQYNNSGLFNNAGSFEGRFNFGLFDVPRTSSVFMEQVSNANFACILAVFTSTRWAALSWGKRAFLMATVALILVSTNGRFASILVALTIVGYFIFPLLSRLTLPLVSVGIAAIAIGINLAFPDVIGDNIIGRITFVGKQFAEAGIGFYFGFDAKISLNQRDSGYSYLIGTTTIFGAFALWLFINFYPRCNDASSKRLTFGLVAYMLGQLLVSSTSLFSIKTATLLWVLVGCVRMLPATTVAKRGGNS